MACRQPLSQAISSLCISRAPSLNRRSIPSEIERVYFFSLCIYFTKPAKNLLYEKPLKVPDILLLHKVVSPLLPIQTTRSVWLCLRDTQIFVQREKETEKRNSNFDVCIIIIIIHEKIFLINHPTSHPFYLHSNPLVSIITTPLNPNKREYGVWGGEVDVVEAPKKIIIIITAYRPSTPLANPQPHASNLNGFLFKTTPGREMCVDFASGVVMDFLCASRGSE